jgi:hypothetical protein
MAARAFRVGFLGLIACLSCTCLGCSAAPDTARNEGSPRAQTAPANAAGPGREVVFRVKGLT